MKKFECINNFPKLDVIHLSQISSCLRPGRHVGTASSAARGDDDGRGLVGGLSTTQTELAARAPAVDPDIN